ncbi:hypothetical protein TNCV_3054051 [Trichonephila clavipes]|nr:hypothetical protein TNCV_3054051 [Trichonephila clavipes]
MATVDFLHHENPPTWAGIEPATLGTGGQRQTNHATQTLLYKLFFVDSFGIAYTQAFRLLCHIFLLPFMTNSAYLEFCVESFEAVVRFL